MFVESLVEGRKQFQYAVIIVGRAFVGFAVSQLADIVRPVSDYIFVFEPVVIFVSFHESEVGVYRPCVPVEGCLCIGIPGAFIISESLASGGVFAPSAPHCERQMVEKVVDAHRE